MEKKAKDYPVHLGMPWWPILEARWENRLIQILLSLQFQNQPSREKEKKLKLNLKHFARNRKIHVLDSNFSADDRLRETDFAYQRWDGPRWKCYSWAYMDLNDYWKPNDPDLLCFDHSSWILIQIKSYLKNYWREPQVLEAVRWRTNQQTFCFQLN